MQNLPILILAAGASTRMGTRDKLLEPVGAGLTLLRDRIDAAAATGQDVFVTLPAQAMAPDRWAILKGSGATGVAVPEAAGGLSVSLAAGIAALPHGADGAMILPADMPDITTADMLAVLRAFDPKRLVRASAGARPGHPVLFPRDWFVRLGQLSGDKGARDLIRQADPYLIPLPDRHAVTDLDTPEDWAEWRAGKDV